MDSEQTVMGIIVNAGQARSLCFEALRHAKNGQFDQAQGLLQEAQQFANLAHRVQTQLIEHDEGEGKTKMTLVMVHAQDHLMTAMLAKELVAEMIELHQRMTLSSSNQ